MAFIASLPEPLPGRLGEGRFVTDPLPRLLRTRRNPYTL